MKHQKAKAIEILEASGAHFEIGRAMGERFGKVIKRVLGDIPELREKFLSYHKSAAGQERFKELLAINRAAYPDYVDEMEGLAKGAGVTFDELFLLGMRGEYRAYSAGWDGKGCGTCSVLTSRLAVIGHNEDGLGAFTEALFLLKAKPRGKPAFTSLIYPGFIAGNALGFNEAGVCFAANSLSPNEVRTGLGRPFIARSLFEAESIDDAVRRITVAGRAYGFNYTIGSTRERRIINVELSATRHVAKEIEGCDFHANHYVDMKDVPQTIGPSSAARLKRASALLAKKMPETAGDVMALLSDTADKDYPIYRYGTKADQFFTHATSMFDLDRKKAELYTGVPGPKPELCHTFSL